MRSTGHRRNERIFSSGKLKVRTCGPLATSAASVCMTAVDPMLSHESRARPSVSDVRLTSIRNEFAGENGWTWSRKAIINPISRLGRTMRRSVATNFGMA